MHFFHMEYVHQLVDKHALSLVKKGFLSIDFYESFVVISDIYNGFLIVLHKSHKTIVVNDMDCGCIKKIKKYGFIL